MAETLVNNLPVIKEVLKAMDIATIEKAGLEADDLLGTISRTCEEKGMEVAVISGDRDTLQLATEHVKIRIPKDKRGTHRGRGLLCDGCERTLRGDSHRVY